MSISLGAENNFVLDVFTYYHRVYEWKTKIKRNIKLKVFKQDSNYKPNNNNNNNNTTKSSSHKNSKKQNGRQKPIKYDSKLERNYKELALNKRKVYHVNRVSSFKRKILIQAGN